MIQRIEANGIPLSKALWQNAVHIPLPCAGRGTCGKCAIWVRGEVSAVAEPEASLLARLPPVNAPMEGFALRLACYAILGGPCEVILPISPIQVQTEGHPSALPTFDGTEARALGIAVDIGTTTIAAQLYDLQHQKLLAVRGERNQQSAFGADVLSRIAYADQYGLEAPCDSLRRQLQQIMLQLLREADRDSAHLIRVVLTGNTTMLHFAAGLSPHGIGQAPFTPQSLFGTEMRVEALFPDLPKGISVYFPRCIGAYVGADITCGILAARFQQNGPPRLLVDVGTNGELALCVGQRILCCATAAGPAFEGAQIQMGMDASSGAICQVTHRAGQMAYRTIQDTPAKGICGTGLISAVRTLRETGFLDATGAMQADAFAIGDSGICLCQKDIRALQLAKAAIAAGIDTLLHAAAVPADEVEALWLAGGFGSVLDPDDAAAIGLIPSALAPRAYAAGNLALSGAAHMLFSLEQRHTAEALSLKAEELSLATSPYFMEQYMEQMLFPEDA